MGVDSTSCISKLHRFGFSHASYRTVCLHIVLSIRMNLLNVRIGFYFSRSSRRLETAKMFFVALFMVFRCFSHVFVRSTMLLLAMPMEAADFSLWLLFFLYFFNAWRYSSNCIVFRAVVWSDIIRFMNRPV